MQLIKIQLNIYTYITPINTKDKKIDNLYLYRKCNNDIILEPISNK